MAGKMRSIKLLLYTLGCLITFIGCTMSSQPGLSLLLKHDLKAFPSASAIDFHKDKLYVIGDDARNMLILDKEYKIIDSIELFPGESHRIPKKEKADLEAATIIEMNGKDYLIAAGSGSTPEREGFYIFPLDSPRSYDRLDMQLFYNLLIKEGLPVINVEGMTAINDNLVFANRANLAKPDNHLIIMPRAFLSDTNHINFTTAKLKFPAAADTVIGISGLTYVASEDVLLFTASVENTASAYEDGTIGNSYLGYIFAFSEKMKHEEITADMLINLSAIQAEFRNEKIESVCVESTGKEWIIHLVADNDNGTSTLFKMSMPRPTR